MNSNWLSHPDLNQIDPAKKQMLSMLLTKEHSVNQKEMLSFLMTASAKSKQDSLQFTSDETKLILDVLKKSSTPEELQKLDKVLKLFASLTVF